MAATAPNPPTDTQVKYRLAMVTQHWDLLKEISQARYAYAPLGTERSQCLIDLYHAGYAYSWQGVFYLTEAGQELAAATAAV